MTYETIAFASADGVARITLNRPDRLNSFTRAMHGELKDALASLGEARVVILTGAGRGFCAGQDLNDRAVAPGEAVDLGETVETSWNPLIRTLAALPQPVIARVNGVAAARSALPSPASLCPPRKPPNGASSGNASTMTRSMPRSRRSRSSSLPCHLSASPRSSKSSARAGRARWTRSSTFSATKCAASASQRIIAKASPPFWKSAPPASPGAERQAGC